MKVLVKNARIVAPGQALDGASRSILIEEGKIMKISRSTDDAADRIVACPNLHVSPGWMDPFAHFCDPGMEYKETLTSGAAAAAAGGYTTVFILPNTKPPLDNRTQIEYVLSCSQHLAVQLVPIGAITRAAEGEHLAEMYDMQKTGAQVFSDGIHPVASSGLMLKALQYVKAFDGLLIEIPEDPQIAAHGVVHEGSWSTRLGISGKPDIAELMMINRDLALLKYTESKLHFTGISLAESIPLIRTAKEKGLSVSCSVTPYHLVLTDALLKEFDSNYKLTPPLRERQDVDCLREALKEGVIDCISSHHFPQNKDLKNREFEYAEEGMIGLETAFGIVRKYLPELEINELINILSVKSRKAFGMEIPGIEEGERAELTLFDPDKEWVYHVNQGKSKAENSPFDNQLLKGKPIGIINNNKIFINE